jgi:hypothetical protein
MRAFLIVFDQARMDQSKTERLYLARNLLPVHRQAKAVTMSNLNQAA